MYVASVGFNQAFDADAGLVAGHHVRAVACTQPEVTSRNYSGSGASVRRSGRRLRVDLLRRRDVGWGRGMAGKRQRLAARRKAVGFSQEQLAGRLGVERSTVVRWESGETETGPQPWIRPKLARALQVSTEELGYLLAPEAAPQPEAATAEHVAADLVLGQDPSPIGDERWTGRETRALREALRLSVRDFAAHLGVGTRTVANWESGRETICPRHEMQVALDTTLSRLTDDTRTRFTALVQSACTTGSRSEPPAVARYGSGAEPAGANEDGIEVACRAADGRVVFVQVPRRTLIFGAVGAAITASAPSTARPQRTAGWATMCATSELSPVESFRQLRTMLISQDNLAGPGSVLPAVRKQVGLIQLLRQDCDGADRRALLQVQAEYAEFAGWLCQDLGDFRGAKDWTSQALEWAHAVGDRDMVSYVLARKSQLAGDMIDGMSAIDMADAASHAATPHSRLKSVGATYGAFGYALAGNADASERAIDSAVTQLLDAEDADSPWAPWLDRSYIDVQAGRCHAQLGQHVNAIGAYQNALDALPAPYRRDRGVYLARQAFAHAGAGNTEHAAAIGIQAVDIALITGSQRITSELARLDTEISHRAHCPSVGEFKEAFNTVILHEA